MQRQVLTEQSLFYGDIDMPKGFEIDQEKLTNDILQSTFNSKAFRGNYAGIGYTWDEDDNIFWSKKPHASWVKHIESASWKSPIGDAPELTAEQTSQNTPADENTLATHDWHYVWNETNTTWDLTDSKA